MPVHYQVQETCYRETQMSENYADKEDTIETLLSLYTWDLVYLSRRPRSDWNENQLVTENKWWEQGCSVSIYAFYLHA